MRKLMMPFLRISILFLLFCSCKSYQIDGTSIAKNKETTFVNPYFSNPEKDYVYKANIEVYGNHLGGIFVAKKMNDTLHRVVFTSDFGSKLMDFEISENTFKVNYVMEDLDRKILINTLKEDFKILLKTKHEIVEVFENQEFVIYKAKDQSAFNYFYKNKKTNTLEKIINTNKRKERIILEFQSKNSLFAENILILHKNIKLKISLNQLKN